MENLLLKQIKMMVARRYNRKKNLGKLLLKTNSLSSNWKIESSITITTKYYVVDNGNNQIVSQGFGQISGDLSLTSGDCSVYVDVDEFGNNATDFNINSNFIDVKMYWVDFNVLPKLKTVFLSNNTTCEVAGSNLLELESLSIYGSTWNGLDLSLTTKIIYINYRYPVYSDIPLNISNNTELKSAHFWYTYYPTFNVLNHPLLELLTIEDTVNNQLDVNINNTTLPNLYWLKAYRSVQQDWDFGTRNLSNLTFLSIRAKQINNIDQLTSIQELQIYQTTVTSILDLKPLINLTKFVLSYQSSITDILIDNGLNAQITLFENKYNSNTINVKVDNPTDANNGVAPYLPTVWKEYQSYNSWNFI